MREFLQFLFGLAVLVLLAFGLFYFFDIQVGNVNDWLVGIISFIWLVIITTVPWNAHFKAREVLDDAEISKRKDILVIESSLEYVRKVARRSLILAIALHVVSAVVLYFIASLGVSIIGYFAAASAGALTFLRPVVRFYEYLRYRLDNIKQEFRYPREDLQRILERLHILEEALDEEEGSYSWRNEVMGTFKQIEQQLKEMHKQYAKSESAIQKELQQLTEQIQHIRQDNQLQLDKLTTDSKVLDAVRELAKFVGRLKE